MLRRYWHVHHFRLLTLLAVAVVVMVIFWPRQQKLSVVVSSASQEPPTGLQLYIKSLEETVHDASYTGSEAYVNNVRILCLIMTTETRLYPRAQIINATWASRCHKRFFVLQTSVRRPDIINTVFQERRAKVKHAIQYVYQNHILEFDWLLKADDDTYVITQNLQYLLSHYNGTEPGFLGFQYEEFGFVRGGNDYVISNNGIRRLIEFGYKTDVDDLYDVNNIYDAPYDVEIWRYLNVSDVPMLRWNDPEDNQTSEISDVFPSLPDNMLSWSKNGRKQGAGRQFSVTYHYMEPEQMLLVDHLLYRTSVFNLAPDDKGDFRSLN